MQDEWHSNMIWLRRVSRWLSPESFSFELSMLVTLAAPNMLDPNCLRFLMGKQIKHLVSGSSF
jgi:hypothetical protein